MTPAGQPVAGLFAEHYTGMVRLAHLLLDDATHAEDVAQDAFAGLLAHWDKLRDHDRALDYVRSAVLNRSRSRMRSTIRRRQHDALGHIADPHEPGPEISIIAMSNSQHLAQLVRALPRRQREVIVLRYWEDLSEAQIATALGISRGSVKTHASRALSALTTQAGDLR